MELPAGWVVAPLSDLVPPDGIFTDGDWVESKDQDPNGDVRLTQLADVGDGFFRNRSKRFMTQEKAAELRCTFLQEGDILVARMPDPLGRACLYPGSNQPAVTVVDVCVIRAGQHGVNNRWLMWAINSPQVRQQINAYQTGTTRKRISRKNLEKVKLAVPPLAEQQRIVEAIEGHVSRLDAAERDLKTAHVRSNSLQKSALERAMNGEFSVQSDTDEPVTVLLARVESELSQAAKGKRRNSPELAKLSPHASLPSHWAVQPLGSLTRKIEYGTSAKAHTHPADTDVPVLRMGNIQDGRLDMQNLKYLSVEHPDTSKLALSDGDLLFNRTNSAELVGKAAVYRSTMGPATFASYLIRCQLAQGIEPEWVSLCINSPEGRRYINSVAAQQVGQANVNGTKLAAFPIPVPPHGEQLRLLAEMREWHETVGRTANIAQRALRRSAHLRRSLLRHAYSGRLVLQDPADEPANVFLNRIRAEREAHRGKPKRAARRPRKSATADTPPPPSASSALTSTTAVQQELPL
ncbi:restriction endonuclease subunit S [Streptomyces sp. NPDC058464]|uniref:restriction endonuclease subunit S n=1 Tax=Streptomyces sp. NPDC058464 TaxID=3346511 RepID=UPI00365C2282